MKNKWLILVPAVWFALFAQSAEADVLGEWTYSQSCPTSGSVEVIEDTIILHGPDQGGCAGQAHWVKIETTIPADVDTIDFTWSYQTTDGWVYDPPQYGINDVYTLITQQNNATGELSIPVQEGDIFTFRQYSIDTCCAPGHLTIANLSLWASITTSTTSTTTSTTTVPSTTVPATVPTTTTVPETSTSSSTTTTSTTVVLPDTSTSSTSSVPQTTSTVLVPTTTLPPETSAPTPPQIYEPEPTEPYVPEEPEITETGTTTTVVEEPIQEETLPEETTTTTEVSPETYPEVIEETTTSTIAPDLEPNLEPDVPLTDEQVTSLIEEAESVEELVEALAELEPEQVSQVVDAILADEPTQEQAVALATSSEVLAAVSSEQAAEIFQALDVEELSDAQTEELIAVVQEAPTEVREAFENEIDIFKSGLDSYVPVGSNVPVGTRRTLVAITAGITLAAAGVRIKQ
jgi:hypothetical protein